MRPNIKKHFNKFQSTQLEEIHVYPEYFSSRNNYTITGKVVSKNGRHELLFIKTFLKDGKAFTTTKLGRIDINIGAYIGTVIEDFTKVIESKINKDQNNYKDAVYGDVFSTRYNF